MEQWANRWHCLKRISFFCSCLISLFSSLWVFERHFFSPPTAEALRAIQYFDWDSFLFPWIGLVRLCFHKKISWTGKLKYQKLLSNSSGDWEVQGQGLSHFASWWGPSPWLADCCPLAASWHGFSSLLMQGEGAGSLLSYESTDHIRAGSHPHDIIYLWIPPKGRISK